jgi:hypothetical protein
MSGQTIPKPKSGWRIAPNLVDYERTRGAFTWETARRHLDGLPGGRGLNIAHEAVVRHASGPRRDHVALRWIGKQGNARDYTYADLNRLSNRFANVLRRLGVGKGERVFTLAGRVPELLLPALLRLRPGADPAASGAGRRAPARDDAGALRSPRGGRPSSRGPRPGPRARGGRRGRRGRTRRHPRPGHAHGAGLRRVRNPRTRRTRPCCTSPVAPRAGRRARYMSTRRSWPIT